MLTTVLETLCDWLNEEVCSQIQLFAPKDNFHDGKHPPKLVHPVAYPLFIPDSTILPQGQEPLPAIVIQVLNGSDDVLKHLRTYQLRLILISWLPGHYDALDFIKHTKEQTSTGDLPYSYYQAAENAQKGKYTRTLSGWKDNSNFMETVLSAFEQTEFIGKDKTIRLKKEEKITFGHFQTEYQLLDFYPYWVTYITFSIEAGLIRRPPTSYQNLL